MDRSGEYVCELLGDGEGGGVERGDDEVWVGGGVREWRDVFGERAVVAKGRAHSTWSRLRDGSSCLLMVQWAHLGLVDSERKIFSFIDIYCVWGALSL